MQRVLKGHWTGSCLEHSALLAEAEDIVAAALAALPLWRSDLETLLVCPLPLQAETEAVASTFDAARDRLAAVRQDVGNLTAEIADLENEVSRFTRGETVPTPDAVTAARAARDQVWRAIRRMQEGGVAADREGEDALPAGHLPDVFETLRDQADRLADRRADEAQRVADFLLATDRLDRTRERRHAAEEVLRTAEAAATEAEAYVARIMGASRVGTVGPRGDDGVAPRPGGNTAPG